MYRTACGNAGHQRGDSSGDVTGGFAHHMHHDVKKTATKKKNRIRKGWMRLFVRAEMDAVKEPGSQPARQAGQPASPMQSV